MSHQADDLPDFVAERTYALVVGVESYDVSSGWRLPGAASDAQRFARWLTGAGQVPPGNVRLFLSPLPDTALPSDGLPEHQPATEENIRRALFRDLPSCDGDLLWIYWAGHGFGDDREDHLLPYADATSALTSHLKLESALRWWGSSHVDRRRFRHQVAVVDACHMDHERARGLNFGGVDYGKGARVAERRQFVLYAARPGEAARNEAERRSGRFTRTLMRGLGGMTVGESVHRLTDVARGVEAKFGKLREKGDGWQTPTFLVHRGWNGSAIFDTPWTESLTGSGAPQLDQEAWNGLADLARDHDLPACAYDAYCWAFKVCDCATPLVGSMPTGGLTEIVHDLDERQGRPGMPLTLPFVRYLAAHAEDRQWGARLDSWVRTTAERIGARPVPAAPARPAEPAGLHVRLTKAARENGYLVHIWRYQGGFTKEWESGACVALPDARSGLGEHISTLVEAHADENRRRKVPGIKRIEFHVPFELLLDEEFESWAVPSGLEGSSQPMGVLFEVVMRCPDARKGPARQTWREKWEWFETHRGGEWEAPALDARHPVWLLAEEQLPGNLSRLLQKRDLPVCVLAPVGPALLKETLTAVVEAGIPIALWRRGGPPNGTAGTGDLATALTPSEERVLDLRELPTTLRGLRIDAGEASASEPSKETWQHPLALLWDDPNRTPQSERLTVGTPRRGQ